MRRQCGKYTGAPSLPLVGQALAQLIRGLGEALEGVVRLRNFPVLVRVQGPRQLPVRVGDVGLAVAPCGVASVVGGWGKRDVGEDWLIIEICCGIVCYE